METKILYDLGFSEREIKVYIALLEIGETTVGPIASKTRLQHSKVYQTLEKLIDRGLLAFVIKSKTKYFQALPPKRIHSLLKEKERRFLEILPSLNAKKHQAQSPQSARVYEGYPAIKAMFDTIIDDLNHKSYYYVFAFKEEYGSSQAASLFLRNIHLRLSQKKVDDRLIAHQSIKKVLLENYAKILRMQVRFTHLNIPFGLMIINNKVINWVWSKRPTAIEIESEQIAKRYKEFFLDIWKNTK